VPAAIGRRSLKSLGDRLGRAVLNQLALRPAKKERASALFDTMKEACADLDKVRARHGGEDPTGWYVSTEAQEIINQRNGDVVRREVLLDQITAGVYENVGRAVQPAVETPAYEGLDEPERDRPGI
jgi:hypothetical protein